MVKKSQNLVNVVCERHLRESSFVSIYAHILNKYQESNMENHTFISATFKYEEKLVEKTVDFWGKMYNDPIRLYMIGPMKIIETMVFVPAFVGIFQYIRNRPVK